MDSRDQIIGLLYEAAISPQLWPRALDALSGGMSGIGAHLLTFDKERRMPVSSAVGGPAMSPDLMQRYAKGYAHVDPLMPACLRPVPSRRAMLCHQVVSVETVARSAFYQELVIPGGLRYQAGWVVESSPKRQIVLSVHKRKTRFEREELIPWEPVVLHVRHAARLSADLTPLLARGELLRKAIEHKGMACLMTDAAGRVLDCSAQAAALLDHGGVLRLRDQGRLVTGVRSETKQLYDLIARAASGCGSVMRVADGVDGASWLVEVVPGGVAAENPFDRRFANCALLFVSQPELRLAPDPLTIRTALRCTRAEAEVAAEVACGMTPQQIAGKRNVSLNTVRTQIRMLLSETGLNRTADLIGYLNRMH